jgi:diketogulonate reductase-like aldo/keto reductase
MDATARATLNDGHTIPWVGLGVFRTKGGSEAKRAVLTALEVGYRHIDTASIYQNEASVGEAIRESGIPRDQIYVTTKLWNDDHRDPETAFAKSLARLGLEYIDLYLIHWPVPGMRTTAWSKLEGLVAGGKVRSIGVSNYLVKHIEELTAACSIVPAIDQIELSPYNYAARADTVKLCEQKGIVMQAYSPLTRGQKLDDPKLVAVATRYKKSTAQILIRWALQKKFVVLPKSAKPTRIRENFEVFDFELSSADMDLLDGFNESLNVAWDPSTQA